MKQLKMIRLVVLGFILMMPSWAATQIILVMGDSLSASYGIEIQQGWVSLLQQKLLASYQVINTSISGNTTANGLSGLPQVLTSYRPKIVLLELGGNDGLRGLPVAQIRNNLNAMIQMVKHYQAIPILIGVRLPPNYGAAYTSQFQQIYVELAKQHQIPLVPLLLTGIDTKAEWMQADGIHPRAVAQPKMLATVWQTLQPLLATSTDTSLANANHNEQGNRR